MLWLLAKNSLLGLAPTHWTFFTHQPGNSPLLCSLLAQKLKKPFLWFAQRKTNISKYFNMFLLTKNNLKFLKAYIYITNVKATNIPRYLKCSRFENKFGRLLLWNKSQNHGEKLSLHCHKHLVHLLRKNLAFGNMLHSPFS